MQQGHRLQSLHLDHSQIWESGSVPGTHLLTQSGNFPFMVLGTCSEEQHLPLLPLMLGFSGT